MKTKFYQTHVYQTDRNESATTTRESLKISSRVSLLLMLCQSDATRMYGRSWTYDTEGGTTSRARTGASNGAEVLAEGGGREVAVGGGRRARGEAGREE